MKTTSISIRQPIARRSFLRGAGVALGLPLLDAMLPAFARADATPTPRRFFAVCNNLGVLPGKFFPAANQTGRNYQLSPYLELLAAHRNDFTVFSGVWHPDVDGGHPADNCFLTAAPHPGSGGFRNTISLDQFAAEHIGNQTRFPSLTLGVNVQQGQRSLSWTSGGVLIPSEEKASEVFKRLFLGGSPDEVQAQMRRLALGQSVMDAVADQTRGLQRNLGPRDRERLDQYFTGVRDLEQRLGQAAEWERRPKPVVNEQPPTDPADARDYLEKVRLMFDMARLAFETDSTRLIALLLDGVNSPAIRVDNETFSDGYHAISHHGRSPEKLRQLELVDRAHMRLLDRLFTDLKARKEGGETLLDRTMVLFGTNLGDANAHVTTNLPTLFAGGGFKHGQHLAFDRERNYPLSNLFVNVLQRLGIEVDRFSTGASTMRGLEMA
ncbi:MAG: DUF1552 domain-containing protein [Blastocatellia bacterium]|nr:DUF1552 domain-containing protein [Blastocatellia bacterium]